MGLKRAPGEGDMEISPIAKRRLCSTRGGPDAAGALRTCDVCLESASDAGAIRLGACGHMMCGSCAEAWCSSVVGRCLAQGAPLRCALPRCGRPVPLQQAQQLLELAGMMNAEAGAAFEAAALIPEEAQFTCPYPDCGVMSELEAALPDAPSACPSCGRWVCPCCRCMWHAGLRCSQYQALGTGPPGCGPAAADRRCRVFWRRASGARQHQQQQQQQQQFQQQHQQQRDPTQAPRRDQNGQQAGASMPMSP